VGERLRLVDSAGTVRGEVETTRVTIVPLHLVGDDVARDEGEGFADAAAWRRAHKAYWTGIADLVREEAGDPDRELRDAEPVVVHRIRLVRPAGAQSAAGSRSADQRSSMRPSRQTTSATSQASTNSATIP
jgi:ASCH domain